MIDAVLAVTILARIIVGGTLLWAGVSKLRNFDHFRSEVERSGYLSFAMSKPAAAVVVLTEVVLGSLLLSGVALRQASIAAIVLVTGFTVFLMVRLMRGDTTSCSCFGTSERAIGFQDIIRNIGFVFLAATLLIPGQLPLAAVEISAGRYTPAPPATELILFSALVLPALFAWRLLVQLVALVDNRSDSVGTRS